MAQRKDELPSIAKFGRGGAEWQLAASGDPTLDQANRTWLGVRRLDGEFTEQIAAIDADAELSDLGKAARRRKAAEAHRDALAPYRAGLRNLTSARDKALARAVKGQPVEDRLAALLQAQEIRRWLPDDPLKVFELYSDALEAGDVATLNAVESAPRLWPGRPSADQLTSMQEKRLAILSPEVSQEVAILNDALGDVTAALDTAEAYAVERGGLAGPDNVVKMAEGKPERTISAEPGGRVA